MVVRQLASTVRLPRREARQVAAVVVLREAPPPPAPADPLGPIPNPIALEVWWIPDLQRPYELVSVGVLRRVMYCVGYSANADRWAWEPWAPAQWPRLWERGSQPVGHFRTKIADAAALLIALAEDDMRMSSKEDETPTTAAHGNGRRATLPSRRPSANTTEETHRAIEA